MYLNYFTPPPSPQAFVDVIDAQPYVVEPVRRVSPKAKGRCCIKQISECYGGGGVVFWEMVMVVCIMQFPKRTAGSLCAYFVG